MSEQASLGHIVSGLSSGTAILTSFSGEGRSTVLKQFVPQNSRSCNYLAWNPHQPSQFAVAMEKVRNDFSVLVWDVDHSEPSRPPPSRGPLDRKSLPSPPPPISPSSPVPSYSHFSLSSCSLSLLDPLTDHPISS